MNLDDSGTKAIVFCPRKRPESLKFCCQYACCLSVPGDAQWQNKQPQPRRATGLLNVDFTSVTALQLNNRNNTCTGCLTALKSTSRFISKKQKVMRCAERQAGSVTGQFTDFVAEPGISAGFPQPGRKRVIIRSDGTP